MTNYEKIQYCSKLIEGATGIGTKMQLKLPFTYRNGNGHFMFNTNGVMDFVVGDISAYVYEVVEFKEDRLIANGWDKILDRVSRVEVWYTEFEIIDSPKIKTYEQ
jgi:hypothetical protein